MSAILDAYTLPDGVFNKESQINLFYWKKLLQSWSRASSTCINSSAPYEMHSVHYCARRL